MPTAESFYEHLPCVLDSRALVLKSKALAELLADQAKVELEKKLANQDFKERLDDLDARMAALAEEVRTGREYREVACVERADYQDGRVEVVRTDTGEVVRIRPLQPAERQAELVYAPPGRRDDHPDEFEEKLQ